MDTEQQGMIREAISRVNTLVDHGKQWILPALYRETLRRIDEPFAEAMLFVLDMRAAEDEEFALAIMPEEERIAA